MLSIGRFYIFFIAVLLGNIATPPAFGEVTTESLDFAVAFRESEPLLVQDIVISPVRNNDHRTVLLTEPPAKSFLNRKQWLSEVFGNNLVGWTIHQHKIGYDGLAKDIVIEVAGVLDADFEEITKKIHMEYFGTDYGSSFRVFKPKSWNAEVNAKRRLGPPDLQISAASLNSWLLEDPELRFTSDTKIFEIEPPTDAELPLLFQNQAVGLFYSEPVGVVLLMLDQSESLNDQIPTLRRFLVDTDLIIGAIKPNNGSHLAIVGRARTTSLVDMPPLRIDTLLTLASSKQTDLSQSFELNLPLAGKVTSFELAASINSNEDVEWLKKKLTGTVDQSLPVEDLTDSELFLRVLMDLADEQRVMDAAVDWGPTLLSREITHTEYGHVLNFTDSILKGWAEANRVVYPNFKFPRTYKYPDAQGLFFQLKNDIRVIEPDIGFNELTYNWNTAGYASWTTFGDFDVFSIARTGSLPVSFFPDDGGFKSTPQIESHLKQTEDRYWDFYAGLKDPYLIRAAQYAAIFILTRQAELKADRSEQLVSEKEYGDRWNRLKSTVGDAIEALRSSFTSKVHPLENQNEDKVGIGFFSLDKKSHCTPIVDETYSWEDLNVQEALGAYLGLEASSEKLASLLVDPGELWGEYVSKSNKHNATVTKLKLELEKSQSDNSGEILKAALLKCSSINDSSERMICLESALTRFDQVLVDDPDPLDFSNYVERKNNIESGDSGSIKALEASLRKSQEELDVYQELFDIVQFGGVSFPTSSLNKLHSFGNCDAAWKETVAAVPDHELHVYKTPGIVVSDFSQYVELTGGHNLGGRTPKVRSDASLKKGDVKIDADGSVIRLHPEDMARSQSVVRAFERDFNRNKGQGFAGRKTVIEGELKSILKEDTRAILAYDQLALGITGKAPPEVGSASWLKEVSQRPILENASYFGRAVDASAGKKLTDLAAKNNAQMIMQKLDDGTYELATVVGKEPIVIASKSRSGLQAGLEDLVEYSLRAKAPDIKNITLVDTSGKLSLGDMQALKYSGEARALAGAGGSGKPPTNGIRGLLFDADVGPSGAGAGGWGGWLKFPKIGFSSRNAKSVSPLLKTDVDWANASVSPVRINVGKQGGTLSTQIKIGFAKSEPVGQSWSVRIRTLFSNRKPTTEDRRSLAEAISDATGGAKNEELWKTLDQIRKKFDESVTDDGKLMFYLRSTSGDFFIVDKRNNQLPDLVIGNG